MPDDRPPKPLRSCANCRFGRDTMSIVGADVRYVGLCVHPVVVEAAQKADRIAAVLLPEGYAASIVWATVIGPCGGERALIRRKD